jgi:ankyrin repeat protein
VAAWAGQLDVVKLLLERGADRGAASTAGHLGVSAGTAPLGVAELKDHREVAALLRE